MFNMGGAASVASDGCLLDGGYSFCENNGIWVLEKSDETDHSAGEKE